MSAIARCAGCGEPVRWLKHERTGKPTPIDVAPVEDGNIRIVGSEYAIVPKAQRVNFPGELHKSHFATCVEAASFRGGRNG